MFVDVHVHSPFSEGVDVDAKAIFERLVEEHVAGVAFTDRESTEHADELIRLGEEHGVRVFIGVEIATDRGVLLGFVPEVDDFYHKEEWRSLLGSSRPNAQEVIDLFRAKGGAVIAAHPYYTDMPWSMGDRIFELQGLSAVESFVPWLPFARNAFAVEAGTAMKLPLLAGSAFWGTLSDLGRSLTLFRASVETQAEFVEALRSGEFWAAAVGINVEQDEPSAPPFAVAREARPERMSNRSSDRGGRSGGRGGDRGGRGGRDSRGGRSGGRGGRDSRGGDRGGRGGRGGRPSGSGGERGDRRSSQGDRNEGRGRGPRREDGGERDGRPQNKRRGGRPGGGRPGGGRPSGGGGRGGSSNRRGGGRRSDRR